VDTTNARGVRYGAVAHTWRRRIENSGPGGGGMLVARSMFSGEYHYTGKPCGISFTPVGFFKRGYRVHCHPEDFLELAVFCA
jgi:hypothetical protein